jgi:hypothetical protein
LQGIDQPDGLLLHFHKSKSSEVQLKLSAKEEIVSNCGRKLIRDLQLHNTSEHSLSSGSKMKISLKSIFDHILSIQFIPTAMLQPRTKEINASVSSQQLT